MLQKPIKINGKVWFSSDFHFNHLLTTKLRGFSTPEEQDSFVLKSINDNVKKDDSLIYLGDFSLNSDLEKTSAIFGQIICDNIYYVWGNHESYVKKIYSEEVKKQFALDLEVYPLKWGKVTFLGCQASFRINKKPYFCSHFAHRIWDKSHYNVRHCCGHSHGSDPESLPDFLGCKRLDVGWDVFKRPVSFEEVEEIMAKKEVKYIDHHNK